MTKTKLIIEINEEILNNPHNFPEYVFRKAVLNGKPLQAELEEIKTRIDEEVVCVNKWQVKNDSIKIIDERISELKGENNG